MPNQYTRDHLTPLQAAHEIVKILDRVQYAGDAKTLALVCDARGVSLLAVMETSDTPGARVEPRR